MRDTLWCGLVGALLVACGPPVKKELLREISDDLAKVGHPFGEFQEVKIVDWRKGNPLERKRYVDVEVRYVRGLRPEPNTMLVRLYQESVKPCRIELDVLSDDGPNPWLLDNKLASQAIGRTLCKAVRERS